jgi:hypothetical protein
MTKFKNRAVKLNNIDQERLNSIVSEVQAILKAAKIFAKSFEIARDNVTFQKLSQQEQHNIIGILKEIPERLNKKGEKKASYFNDVANQLENIELRLSTLSPYQERMLALTNNIMSDQLYAQLSDPIKDSVVAFRDSLQKDPAPNLEGLKKVESGLKIVEAKLDNLGKKPAALLKAAQKLRASEVYNQLKQDEKDILIKAIERLTPKDGLKLDGRELDKISRDIIPIQEAYDHLVTGPDLFHALQAGIRKKHQVLDSDNEEDSDDERVQIAH